MASADDEAGTDIDAHAPPKLPDDAGGASQVSASCVVQGQRGRDDVLLAIHDFADESRNSVRQSSL